MADTENNKNFNSPALRFPGFSEPWKRIRLGDNCTIQMCKRIFANQTSEAGDVPFFKIGTIGSRPDAFISKELFDEYKTKYNYPIEGEVMITCAGTVGKTLQFDGSDSYFQDSNIVWIHNPNQLTINDFLAYILGKINWNKLNSTTITRIYNDDLRNLFYYAPENVAEQRNIVSLLRLIDERIATQRRLIEDLEKLKSSIVDRTFSDVDGEVVRYRDLLEVSNLRNDGKADYRILSASQEFGMIERESLDIDIKAEAKSVKAYKRVQAGDYVLHLRSFQGGLAFAEVEGICSPAYTILRPNKRLEYGYLKEYFKSSKFIKSLVFVTYGIRDGRSINVDEFLDMTISIHPKDKQAEIVKSLSILSVKLNVEASILNIYEQQRNYLHGNLFI